MDAAQSTLFSPIQHILPIDLNTKLADDIVAKARTSLFNNSESSIDNIIEMVNSQDFRKDPVSHLIYLMVERGVSRCRTDDIDRAFVISEIPNFSDKLSSIDYLKSVAEAYFKDHADNNIIMDYFEKSSEKEEFQNDLKQAVDRLVDGIKNENESEIDIAERALRKALTIFRQAERFEYYVSQKFFVG